MINKILLIILCIVLLSGCSGNNIQQSPSVVGGNPSATVSGYPGPVTLLGSNQSSSYPAPAVSEDSREISSTQQFFVEGLVVPAPKPGKAIVTGILLKSRVDSDPFITSIYLVPISSSDQSGPSLIESFDERSNPIAVQDIQNGLFVFNEVAPGKYALVIWSQNGGTPLVDDSGTNIIVEVSSDEIKDVGKIHVP